MTTEWQWRYCLLDCNTLDRLQTGERQTKHENNKEEYAAKLPILFLVFYADLHIFKFVSRWSTHLLSIPG